MTLAQFLARLSTHAGNFVVKPNGTLRDHKGRCCLAAVAGATSMANSRYLELGFQLGMTTELIEQIAAAEDRDNYVTGPLRRKLLIALRLIDTRCLDQTEHSQQKGR